MYADINETDMFTSSECQDCRKLKELCKQLLDSVNEQYPSKVRTEWRCPHFQAISDFIKYEKDF